MSAPPADAPVLVRDATPEDAAALAPLLAGVGFATEARELAARLRALLGAGELLLVATRGAATIGVVTVHVTPVLHRPTPVGRLTLIAVAEGERRHGVGRALVAAAERAVAARGCALIEVTSHRRWTGAHAFYERLGYAWTSLRFGKELARDG